jgi:Na+/H+ antiporter NhaD/arsenite permease-like protein
LQKIHFYGTIIGAERGPAFTPVGSVAIKLRLLKLSRKRMEISPVAYAGIGIRVTPILPASAITALWLMGKT